MAHGKSYTNPALLTGLWTLLTVLNTLETYDLDQLRQIATIALPNKRDGTASTLV
jgi:hypothetical protein